MNYRTNEDKRCFPTLTRPLYNNFQALDLSTETGTEPVSLDEAKDHCLIRHDDDDDFLTRVIKSCRRTVEHRHRKSFIARTVKARIKNELGGQELQYGPVTSLVSAITATDTAGTVITLSDSDFEQDGGYFRLKSIYSDIILTYEAGLVPETVPEEIKTEILELVAYKYAHRGDEEKSKGGGIWLL